VTLAYSGEKHLASLEAPEVPVRSPIAIFSAAFLAAACATGKSASTEPKPAPAAPPVTVNNTGTPGEAVATRTETLSATVTAVDPATRTLTVKGPDGEVESFQVEPEVKRFGEIAPGDVITLEVRQGLLLEFQAPGTPDVEPDVIAGGTVAGKETAPGAAAAAGVQATMTVIGIDPKTRVVTLQGPHGNQHRVTAGPKVQLEKLKVGDRMLATYVESLAVAVEKAGTKL
jgi:Cu/Ag efflux protein CusF